MSHNSLSSSDSSISHSTPFKSQSNLHDQIIQQTNTEATLCKYALLRHRYIVEDDMLERFIGKGQQKGEEQQGEANQDGSITGNSIASNAPPGAARRRRTKQQSDPNLLELNPLMLRGYWSRVYGIWQIVQAFVQEHAMQQGTNQHTCQIINLGAGFDTMRWRLKLASHVKMLEVDYDSVMRHKKEVVLMHKDMHEALGTIRSVGDHSLVADHYVLYGCDLRDTEGFEQLVRTHLDTSVPTLIISEVVLVYMDASYSDALISSMAGMFERSTFVLYEQVQPNDSFGQVMVEKLAERGCPLLSIHKYPTVQSQEQRFQSLGYPQVRAYDMNQIYNTFLDPKEKMRIQRLQIFDEFEEWHLIQSHYCLLVAHKDVNNTEVDMSKTWLQSFWNVKNARQIDMSRFIS